MTYVCPVGNEGPGGNRVPWIDHWEDLYAMGR